MMKVILFFSLLISGCGMKTPQNDWQRKSTYAFSSYTKNFLNDNGAIAKSDLARAVKHAKQSANLTQLAKIYLGACALNISAGQSDECLEYQNIADLNADKKLDAYYHFLRTSLTKEEIVLLPIQYQSFAKTFIHKDFSQANKEVLKMKKASSSYLSAALLQENIENKTRKKVIQTASYNGHKKIVLYSLYQIKKATSDYKEIENIQRKISILESNK